MDRTECPFDMADMIAHAREYTQFNREGVELMEAISEWFKGAPYNGN